MGFFLLWPILTVFTLKATIVPENDLLLYDSGKSEGLSVETYHEVIDHFESVYQPILQKTGNRLIVNRPWENPRVNAGTTKKGKEIIINLYGGYARHPYLTPDAYSLVICHELGHHLGGFPKKIFQDGKQGWPSVEGQADYFATLKCLRELFKKTDVNLAEKIPSEVRTKCQEVFSEKKEQSICVRSALAGMVVAKISSDIRRYELPLSFGNPDNAIVSLTYESHPLPQCRLDTYFQGSLCEISSFTPISNEDEISGSCHKKNGHKMGSRPYCWFRPSWE